MAVTCSVRATVGEGMRLSFLVSDLLDEDLESNVRRLAATFRDMSPTEADRLVRKIAESDPTENKAYLQWLVKQVKLGLIRLPEDHERVNEVLKMFGKLKHKFPEKDINRYTFHELEAKADQLKGVKTTREAEREIKTAGAKKVYESGGLTVIEITTPEAAEIYGKGTKWCTSNKGTAAEYLEKGPLYVVVRDGQKEAQFDLSLGQAKDVTDQDVELKDDVKTFVRGIKAKGMKELHSKALLLGKRLSKEEEAEIAKDPRSAYRYASHVIKGRWPEGEKAIAKDPESAFLYARDAIKGRWPEAEAAIAKDPGWAYLYAKDVI